MRYLTASNDYVEKFIAFFTCSSGANRGKRPRRRKTGTLSRPSLGRMTLKSTLKNFPSEKNKKNPHLILPLGFRWYRLQGSNGAGGREFRQTYFRCHPSNSRIGGRGDREPKIASRYQFARKV